MKIVLRIREQKESAIMQEFFPDQRSYYVADVLSAQPGKDGKRVRLLLPGLMGSGPNKSQLEGAALEHLRNFGFSRGDIEVEHGAMNVVK